MSDPVAYAQLHERCQRAEAARDRLQRLVYDVAGPADDLHQRLFACLEDGASIEITAKSLVIHDGRGDIVGEYHADTLTNLLCLAVVDREPASARLAAMERHPAGRAR